MVRVHLSLLNLTSMIPIGQLTIGSLVITDKGVSVVDSISSDAFSDCNDGKPVCFRILEEGGCSNFYEAYKREVFPLPIEEKYLIAFGFRKPSGAIVFISKCNRLVVSNNGDVWKCIIVSSDCIMNLKYVHELQMFYTAIFGEDLRHGKN